MVTLNLNGDRLIQLPVEDSKANYLAGFWRWVELLAASDYQEALQRAARAVAVHGARPGRAAPAAAELVVRRVRRERSPSL